MKNFDWQVYTYRHRRAFVYVAENLIKDEKLKQNILTRAKVHDMDKMLMYMFLDQTVSQLHHVKVKSHHLDSGLCVSYEDMVELIIDYECAPYTKPDKPLNAYDFTHKLIEKDLIDEVMADKLFAIMHTLGIDKSYNVMPEVKELPFMQNEVTEEDILLEIIYYVSENDVSEFDFIKKELGININNLF